MTHTPGLWHVTGPGKPNGPERSADFAITHDFSDDGTKLRIIAEVFEVIGKTDDGSYLRVDAEANARLIAAAPDLLEALRNLVGAWKEGVLSWEDDMPQALAAIRKAEGAE